MAVDLVDESVISKRTYNRGHLVEQKWIVGMYDVEQKVGVIVFVEDKTQQPVFPIIEVYCTCVYYDLIYSTKLFFSF